LAFPLLSFIVSEVTQILSEIEDGDGQAAEKLLPLVYDELRKLAAARMSRENTDQTLQATALVHEAYIRLVDNDKGQHWDNRAHFFAAAAEAMRRIIVESARRKRRMKHGGAGKKVDRQIDRIKIEVDVRGPLDEEQRARLLDIAHKCPVHRTLQSEIDMPTSLREGVAE
jgi:RNA polymerase sigma factor (TIGR02999 family)